MVAIFAVRRSFKAPRQVLPVIEVVSLSVVRKSQAPSSGNSTAAARCLRGGKRPVRRHRAFARCPCSFYRSLVCLSVFSGSCPRHIILPWQPLTI